MFVCVENDWIQASPACFSLEIIATSDQRGRGRGEMGIKEKGKSLLATTLE